jgi:hypothetical protein
VRDRPIDADNKLLTRLLGQTVDAWSFFASGRCTESVKKKVSNEKILQNRWLPASKNRSGCNLHLLFALSLGWLVW